MESAFQRASPVRDNVGKIKTVQNQCGSVQVTAYLRKGNATENVTSIISGPAVTFARRNPFHAMESAAMSLGKRKMYKGPG